MSLDNIEHVVVLMLENRSFDGMLGWLYEEDSPQLIIPDGGPAFQGLNSVDLSAFVNRADDGLSSPPVRGTAGFAIPSMDPGEEFAHVNMQFYGTATPAPGAVPTMTGVLQDFVNVLRSKGYSESDIQTIAPSIMQTYTQSQLPVLNQLARHYGVSDEWFASVPSQTNPNRAFLMTGTSHGLVNNGQLETDPRAQQLESILGMGIGDDRFPDPTIFNALAAANKDWAVFWQTSYLPQKIATLLNDAPLLSALTALLSPALSAALMTLLAALSPYSDYINELASGQLSSDYTWRLFPAIQGIPNANAHFQSLDQFHTQARAGQLPTFSYIEPWWTIAQTTTNAGFKNLFTQMGNDYHPPGNLVVSEAFVKDVYGSLIANQNAWNKTLLIITFDEFVGSFDHVAPPTAQPPWTTTPPFPTNGFDFARFGARIPTILVSPWIQKGTVFRSSSSVPYDHTSVIATTLNWLGQEAQVPSFGARTAAAPTFEDALTLTQPRTDAGEIGFLDLGRDIGDPVLFGDPILLRNQNGSYLTAASRTMKVGTALPSSDLMGFAVDLNLAAYFPTMGEGSSAPLTFLTSQPDTPSQVADGTTVNVVSLEPAVGASNFLGAWSDSHDCYYYNNYTQGGYIANESWVVRQASRHGQPLAYGDNVYLENVSFAGQQLTPDDRWFVHGNWVTTNASGSYWTVQPAQRPQFGGPLGACSWGTNRIDVFGLNGGANVLQLSWDGTGWHWVNQYNGFAGTQLTSQVTACSWGTGRIDTFGLNDAGYVLHLFWDGTAWHWDDLGNGFSGTQFAGQLAACSWGPDRIDIFGLDANANVLQLFWDGIQWNWANLGASTTGAQIAGQLTACSWGPNRIDVFGLDSASNVLQLYWDGTDWNWADLGTSPTGTQYAWQPSACSWGLDRIDVLGLDTNSNVLQLYWDGTGWHWANLGNSF